MKQALALVLIIGMISSPSWAAKIMDPSAYTIQPVNLNGYAVNCIAFSADRAWIGTDLGLLSSDLSQPVITQQLNSANAGLPSDRITALAVNGEDIWVGTDMGLAKLTIGKNKAVIPANSPFKKAWIMALAVDQKGLLWIGAMQDMENGEWTEGIGLSSYDGKTWQRYTKTNSTLPEEWISGIVVDEKNTKWLGTTYHPFMQDYGSGLCSFDGKSFRAHGPKDGPSDVTCLVRDQQNKLWMGLDYLSEGGPQGGGLASYDGQSLAYYDKESSGIPGNLISALATTKDGKLWMGITDMHEGDNDRVGLASFDGKNWELIDYKLLPGMNAEVTALQTDPSGKLWVGTDTGLAVISFTGPKPAETMEFYPYEDPPQVIGSIRPVYPDAAKRAKLQGTVVLEVEVFSDGRVGQITVKRSVKGLDEAAVDAVKKVKFKPGKLSGKAINTTVIIPIEFRLN